MAARKPDFSAKVKVWLPTYTMELDGGLVGCIKSMFRAVPDDKREALLTSLTTINNDLKPVGEEPK